MRRAILLSLILLLSFAVRVMAPWGNVFTADGVLLQENDAWYHRRVVELLQANWPRRVTVDPLGQPGGAPLHHAMLFDRMVALVSLGGGEARRDTALALAPAVLGVLAVALAWLIGRRLGGERAGVVAGLAMGLTPGPFALVSRLGFADHHVLEALVAAWTLYELLRLDGKRRWVDGWRLGLALAVFCFTWAGAAMLLGVVGLFLLSEVWRKERLAAEPLRMATGMAVVASLLLGGQLWQEYTIMAAGGLLGLALVWNLPRKVLAGAGIAMGVVVVAWMLQSSEGVLILRRLAPMGSRGLVAELRPLLSYDGKFDLWNLWREFGFTLPFAVAGWVLMLTQLGERKWRLVWGWATLFFGLTLLQYRMGPYAMLGLALLAGRVAMEKRWLAVTVAVFVGLFNLPLTAKRLAQNRAPRPEIRMALAWLRQDSPPLEKGAYSIQNWWDTGYLISSLGQRIPASNPTQYKALEAARFYTTGDRAEALRLLRASGARYVWFDHYMPMREGGPNQFQAMLEWAERKREDYFVPLLRRREGGGYEATVFFTPAYYQTVLGRVYLHRAKAFSPRNSTAVVEVEGVTLANGRKAQAIVREKVYASYELAVQAVRQTPGAMLLGHDAAVSCVPLEEWPEFEPVYVSPARIKVVDGAPVGAVDIFEVKER